MDKVFLDTAFVIGLLNPDDQHHPAAVRLEPQLIHASEIWTTEAVLVEVANWMAALDRLLAARFIKTLSSTPNAKIVTVAQELFHRALSLYESRADKSWGLTDCISFVVMKDHGLTDALTADRHFVQAGFNALL